jgi:rare lipoprotein A
VDTKLQGTLLLALLLGVACAPRVEPLRDSSGNTGYASWYGGEFHEKRTASGETYDMFGFTAAHRTAPFGTMVRVVNLENGASTVVRINDRGPFVRGRVIDLSLAAARALGLVENGTARVRLEFEGKAPSATRLYVQAGSFRERENAERSARRLSKRYREPPLRLESSEGLFRLRFGPFDDEAAAVRRIEELADDGIEAYVLRQ